MAILHPFFSTVLFTLGRHRLSLKIFPPTRFLIQKNSHSKSPLAIYFTNGSVYVSKLLSQEPKPCDNLEGEMAREAGGRRNREGASVCLRLTDSRMHGSNHRNTAMQLSTNLNWNKIETETLLSNDTRIVESFFVCLFSFLFLTVCFIKNNVQRAKAKDCESSEQRHFLQRAADVFTEELPPSSMQAVFTIPAGVGSVLAWDHWLGCYVFCVSVVGNNHGAYLISFFLLISNQTTGSHSQTK